MHVQEIGHVVEGAPRAAIIDQSVRNWPQRKNQLAYGQLATKWIAQDPSGLYWEVVENADSYACKPKSCIHDSLLRPTDR